MRPIERIRRICGLWLLLLLPAAIMAQGHVYSYDDKDVIDGFRWTRVWTDERKYGVRDKKGREVLPMEFDFITYDSRFHGFITKLNVNSSEGFYTRTGKCVIPHVRGYDDIYIREDDKIGYYFEVEKDGYVGICDGKGNEIIKPDKYTGVNSFLPGDKEHPFFCVELNGKYGVCDAVGNEVVPPIYPGWLYDSGEDRWWYLDGYERVDVDAVRKSSDYNPFKENRVNKLKFYADFGGEEAPNSLIPLPTAPPAEERLAETDTEEDKSVEELVAEAKALTKTLNDLTAQAQGTSGSSDAGKTRTVAVPDEGSSSTSDVMISEEEKENIRRKIRRQSMEEVEESLRRKDYIDAYNRSVTIVKDPDFYPKDAEEQCELATLFNEVKIGISSDMMVASAGLDFNRYMALSVVYMDIDGWQKKLLVSAISQGSQKAVLMLQLVNAANGGNSAAPNEPIDFNKDYKPSLIQVEEVCDYCHGTGTVRTQSVPNYGGNAGQFTDEICPSCGGTGKIKRLRNNPDL